MLQPNGPKDFRQLPNHVPGHELGTVPNIIAGQLEAGEVGECLPEQRQCPAIGGERHGCSLPLQFPDDGDAAGGVPKPPTEWGYKDFF